MEDRQMREIEKIEFKKRTQRLEKVYRLIASGLLINEPELFFLRGSISFGKNVSIDIIPFF